MNLGGITYNAASIAARLQPEYQTMLATGMKDDSEESSEFIVKQLGLEPVYIPDMMREINPIKDYKAYKHLLKLIREFKPDIVHTHAAKAGMVGRLAAWRAGVPVIVHTYHGHVFHSYFGKVKTRIILAIERFLGRLSTGIIAISDDQKKELGQIYKVASPSKIHVIELGYDLDPFQKDTQLKREKFRKQYHINEDTIAIGVIGRLVPIKNLELFINSWKMISEKYGTKVKGFIIGDGEQRIELQQLCKDLGLHYSTPEQPDEQAGLVFTSWIYEVDTALAGLDIIALTSYNEGTPASLIEAQAAGKPIVSTKVGGIANIVIEDETALLVPSGDLQRFSESISRLIENEDLRMSMGKTGPQMALSRFHYDRLTSDIRSLYSLLLSKH